MIYRLGVLFCFGILISCTFESIETDIIEENYTYYDQNRGDSIKCIQLGIQYVDEKNALPYSLVKHELVDETPAKVKLEGMIIQWQEDSILIQLGKDSIWANTSFKKENPEPFLGLSSFFQGLVKMHPKQSFRVDALLIKGISK